MFNELIDQILNKISTLTERSPEIEASREILTEGSRDTKSKKPISDALCCPYCNSKEFVRRGWRQKEREKVQLYQCKACQKTFTPRSIKGKHYPIKTIMEAMSLYNLGYSLEESCRRVGSSKVAGSEEPSNTGIGTATLSAWLDEFKDLCRFGPMMREYATKLFRPADMVVTATLAHRQLYRYRFHRAKCDLIIRGDFKHRNYGPLKEFLEMVPGECPHQYFEDPSTGSGQAGLRASEAPLTFSREAMIVRSKTNFANALCTFALQGATERRDRHDTVQKFMLYNDTVTVATEVPVYITRDDIEHLKTQLGFEIYDRGQKTENGKQIADKTENTEKDGLSNPSFHNPSSVVGLPSSELPKLITGHIDLVQIRNGSIHLLDYKPNAAKEQPIDQLTIYAMALSRLTGLRLFEFKCAWFDEQDYFEFFPLHVLYKPKKAKRRRKVVAQEGVYAVNRDVAKVANVRPL